MTIAFNDPEIIELQIQLLKKYLKDDFDHYILDNSSIQEARINLKRICKSHKVKYIGLPKNPYSNNKSHAAAMHWGYFNLIRKSKYSFFGFLDHDIFPTTSYSVLDRIKNGVYGRKVNAYFTGGYHEDLSNEHPYWSLWAGFCFFDKIMFNGIYPCRFNFFSKHFPNGDYLDTGGGLWDKVYSKINLPTSFSSYEVVSLSDKINNDIQNDKIEILDNTWCHFVSLSNWRKVTNIKEKRSQVFYYLQRYL
ncbi:hypothetical protein MM239_04515 [Belliella sp. DSM 111904]|uniref:Glycosyltransferase 2-like domain-containing protein n=1 Tax=Belliella filtrata TaxID=2923435 RepID=A0ABS9UWX8_9BACT|nr:hypothetical protein [Belliella filtrata]MCH7408647.1 hypothetical protein [Belliella filtrata]